VQQYWGDPNARHATAPINKKDGQQLI
jgi:hypothetical protein